MQELRGIIATNIAKLRLSSGMTQQELASKLNYTDKAVSKWERGESVPDVSVLSRIAALFGVSVDYLLTDHTKPIEVLVEQHKEVVEAVVHEQTRGYISNLAELTGFSRPKLIITLMSAALVWLLAIAVYVCLSITVPEWERCWLCFMYAVPATMVALLVLNSIWGRRSNNFVIITLLVWSILISVYFTFDDSGLWKVFLLGIPAQIIILLWSHLMKWIKK